MVGGSNQSAVEGSFKCTWVSKWWWVVQGHLFASQSVLCKLKERKNSEENNEASRHFPARVSAILLPELWSLSRSPPGSSSPDNHDYVHWITTIMYNRIFRIRNKMRNSYVWILIRGSWRLVVCHPRSIAKLLNGRILHNIFSPFPVLVDTFLSLFFLLIFFISVVLIDIFSWEEHVIVDLVLCQDHDQTYLVSLFWFCFYS